MENEEYPIMTVEQFADAVVQDAATSPGGTSVKGNLYGIRLVEWTLSPYDRRMLPSTLRDVVLRRVGKAIQALYAVRSPEQQAAARSYGFVEGPEQQDAAWVADCRRRKAEADRAPPGYWEDMGCYGAWRGKGEPDTPPPSCEVQSSRL